MVRGRPGSLTCCGRASTDLTSYGLGAAYDISKLWSLASGMREADVRGFGDVPYASCAIEAR